MTTHPDFEKASVWYPKLGDYSFFTQFVSLQPSEVQLIIDGDVDNKEAIPLIKRLQNSFNKVPGYAFIFADCIAPTDTKRFEKKGGAVYSAKSAWRIICESEKIRMAAREGLVNFLGIKPYRNITHPREFRLFIRDRKLIGMSQRWLNRHYRRLSSEKVQKEFWELAEKFVEKIAWKLPEPVLVMDIYFTRSKQILIIDLNMWGAPTDPLMFIKWNTDWSSFGGLRIVPPPTTISGDVNVSF